MLKNSDTQYGWLTIVLHWTIGLSIIGLLAVGLYMSDLPKVPDKWQLYGLHKSTGFIVLLLVITRFVWHRISRVPKPLAPPNLVKAATGGHHALYLMMFLMPISGLMMSMGGGHGVSIFGLFDLPNWIPENETIAEVGHFIHEWLGLLAIALVAGHVTMVFYHQHKDKLPIIQRMIGRS